MKKSYAIASALLAASLGLAACSSSGGSKGNSGGSSPTGSTGSSSSTSSTAAGAGSITVGSADFGESQLLADIYADAMSAKGVSVSKKLNIGERPIYIKALGDGGIGMVPEYNGSILYYLDTNATAKSPTAVESALATVAASKGFSVDGVDFSPAQDSDTITVTKATATKYHLTSIGDLASVAKNLAFGAPAGFKTRADGIPALKSIYNVTFGTFTPLSASGAVTPNALKNGTVDAADIFSTDGSIAADNFVSLTDDKSMFAAQNIVPLFAKGKATPTMLAACNAVSAKLDTATLAKLDAQVAAGQDADSVAKAWLSSVGLS